MLNNNKNIKKIFLSKDTIKMATGNVWKMLQSTKPNLHFKLYLIRYFSPFQPFLEMKFFILILIRWNSIFHLVYSISSAIATIYGRFIRQFGIMFVIFFSLRLVDNNCQRVDFICIDMHWLDPYQIMREIIHTKKQ